MVSGNARVCEKSDQRLRRLAEQLDGHRWAAELLDDCWRLVWVFEELRAMRGDDETQLPYGQHFLKHVEGFGVLSEPSRERWLRTNGPFMLDALGGSKAAIAELLGPEFEALVDELERRSPPPRWMSTFNFGRGEFFGRVSYIGERVHDEDGTLIGYLFLYTPGLPASLLALLVRGQRSMYERMAELVEARLRPAAVLFGDLEASTALSRRLSTAVYFRIVRSLRAAFDATVGDRGGIVGKHAGDGVTAFFLSEQLGSDSGAAHPALETARAWRRGGEGCGRTERPVLGEDGLPAERRRALGRESVHRPSGHRGAA